MAPLLEIDDLRVEFGTGDDRASVLNGVSYHVEEGETLAVLGESGSGKSVTAQTVMGILDTPPGRITGGAVRFRGEELLGADPERRRLLRGESMAMIFQDALSALNPVYTVGFQIAEQFRFRRGMSRKDAMVRAAEMLDAVRIPNAKQRVKEYPHQFSGGMRQRAMIAMSLALDPELLIADEPTTALDVTVQAQILDLLRNLQAETGMAHRPTAEGEHVGGAYRRRVTLASGRFAMLDDGLGFQLVPWSPSLEKRLGQQVGGVALPGGGVEWSFGRQRGLSL